MRPNDCRLFPFDIIKKEQKYYLILYKISCINIEKYKTNIEATDKIVNKIIPWISDFTDSNNYNKLSKFDYEIIKEIHIKNISQRVKKVLGEFLLNSKRVSKHHAGEFWT